MSRRASYLTATAIFLALPASAAETGAAASAASAPQGVQEIVVTAEKRTQSIKEIPASVSALSGDVLNESHISGIEDITRATPGVSFGSGGAPGLNNIEIRGVSSTSGSATVGIYLDEVSITVKNFYNGAVEPKLFDLDRVEVLRGPQGTLYGASSMGGTIRYISRKPDPNGLAVSFASDQSTTDDGGINYDEQAVFNLPIVSGSSALRVGVETGSDSGYIDHYTPAGQLAKSNVNKDAWNVLRASALFQPGDGWTITPALFAEHQVINDTSVYYPGLGLHKQSKLVAEPIRNDLFIPSLTVKKDFGWSELTSISSYFFQQLKRVEDGTFYNSEFLAFLVDSDPPNGIANQGFNIGNLPGPEYTNTITSVSSQEIRLASQPGWSELPLTWVVGALYSNYKIRKADNAYVNGLVSTFTNIYGIAPQDSDVFFGSTFPNDSVALSNQHLDESQYAVFGDVTYSILSNLKASAGLRYAYARSAFATTITGFFGITPPTFTSLARYYAATPRFALIYDATDTTTIYANAAKGFRLGGSEGPIAVPLCSADLASIGISTAPTTFGSDKLWSYEAGVKGRYLDNRFSVNADGFYISWDKIQQTIGLPTCGYTLTTNVGDAESYGLELEMAFRPIPSLTLSLSGDAVHAALTSVTANVGASVGDHILNTPEWMATARIEYEHPLTGALAGFVNADYDETGRSHGSFNSADPDFLRPAYGVLNANAGVKFDAVTISLYAKNLLNEDKAIQHPSILFTSEAYTLRPLTVGFNVGVHY